MKYDDASWHYGGDGFPGNSPREYGGTHIALLLKWCLLKGWTGELHLEESAGAVEEVIRGEKSGTEFLFEYCDGKFTNEDLNDQGNDFIGKYYGDHGEHLGEYLGDYETHFRQQMYVTPESEHDFALFSQMVNSRYRAFVNATASRPWWMFW
jgi:hypothetical protein